MAHVQCGARLGFLVAAIVFALVQMRLFTVQSEYAIRATAAVESEEDCQSNMRSIVDKLMTQEGTLTTLEDGKTRLEKDNAKLGNVLMEYQSNEQMARLSGKLKEGQVAAVLIMTHNRPDYLDRTLKSVSKYRKQVAEKFPLFVSQDGTMQAVKEKARSYPEVSYLQHLDESPPKTKRPGEIIAYYKIASHYKWALTQLFDKLGFRRVIILEASVMAESPGMMTKRDLWALQFASSTFTLRNDQISEVVQVAKSLANYFIVPGLLNDNDMEIAPDFFDYFEAMSSLLDVDRTLVAVSSWNDNGQQQFVQDPESVYRSDFFPGLGWMLTKSVWEELMPIWPDAYWDDWVRLNTTRKGRQFLRPEVCRTYNFGEHGSSLGQFYKTYLKPIKLNDMKVDWKSKDLSSLYIKQYNSEFGALVAKAKLVQPHEALEEANTGEGDMRILYTSQPEYEDIAKQFGIFQEWKDGVPRTGYNGVTVFRWKGAKRVFLTAPNSLRLLGVG